MRRCSASPRSPDPGWGVLWFWAAAASPEASWLAYLGPFVPFGGLATLVIIWQQRQMMAKDERIAQLSDRVVEQAGWEERAGHGSRKALVARLYADAHLADHGPLRGLDRPAEDLDHFDDLARGARAL